MCGIYGRVALNGVLQEDVGFAPRMARALRHRGPDGHRVLGAGAGVIGATRLRVIDLDPRGDQPFRSPDGALLLVCNGEIYNAAEIRARYSAYPFRSETDVECILPLVLDRGPAGLADLIGMYAIALWDARGRRLVLARDRAGEKPLFYARAGAEVIFASELGPLLEAGRVPARLARCQLAEWTRRGYVEAPRTLLENVHSVPAGTLVTLEEDGEHVQRYWDIETIVPESTAPALDELRTLMVEAVRRQLRADVPLGIFASGGLDSSLIAAIAVRSLGQELSTFSVGFSDRRYSEVPFARRLARWLGVPHQSIVADEPGMRAALDDLLDAGEPLTDPAALPTYVLAQAARSEVTVVLSGEGGDELFGGYPTYLGHRFARSYASLPPIARRSVSELVRRIPASGGRVPVRYLLQRFVTDAARPWRTRHERWFGPGLPERVLLLPPDAADESADRPRDVVGAAMRLDYRSALPHRLLTKLDRATMRASLEARAPLLDPAVTRAALRIPGARHVGLANTKRVLKAVAGPLLPRFIVRRRKRGLSVPIADWLNGGLAADVDELLSPGRLAAQGLFDPDAVARVLGEHRHRRADHGRGLWALFVFQLWMERWGVKP